MTTVLVVQLSHYAEVDEGASRALRGFSDYLHSIVAAATAGAAGQEWMSVIPCRRRPERRRHLGSIAVQRTDDIDEIRFRCTNCSERGVVREWSAMVWTCRGSNARRCRRRCAEANHADVAKVQRRLDEAIDDLERAAER